MRLYRSLCGSSPSFNWRLGYQTLFRVIHGNGYMGLVITSLASSKNTQLFNECKTALALNHCVPVICFHNHILQCQAKTNPQTAPSSWWLQMKCSIY